MSRILAVGKIKLDDGRTAEVWESPRQEWLVKQQCGLKTNDPEIPVIYTRGRAAKKRLSSWKLIDKFFKVKGTDGDNGFEDLKRHLFDAGHVFDDGRHVSDLPGGMVVFCGRMRPAANYEKVYITESGFFHNGMYIDAMGGYQESSLNAPGFYDMYMNYRAPQSARDIVLNKATYHSKYKQSGSTTPWPGVVLALQRPRDASIGCVSDRDAYIRFVEGACQAYGKDLLLKRHPMGAKEDETWQQIAQKYGVEFGRYTHDVIEGCRFVLVYNSTYAVDAMIRGVPVVQFAPGYFYKTRAVDYSAGTYPEEARRDCGGSPRKLVDFLAWKYCVCTDMSPYMWALWILCYAETNEPFPLDERISWAACQLGRQTQ